MKKFSLGWSLIRIYTFLVYVFMFAPIVVVIVLAFNPKQFGIFPMEGVSWRWFIKLAHNESIIEAFKNSLILGSMTAVISTAIGILAALAFIRRRYFYHFIYEGESPERWQTRSDNHDFELFWTSLDQLWTTGEPAIIAPQADWLNKLKGV